MAPQVPSWCTEGLNTYIAEKTSRYARSLSNKLATKLVVSPELFARKRLRIRSFGRCGDLDWRISSFVGPLFGSTWRVIELKATNSLVGL